LVRMIVTTEWPAKEFEVPSDDPRMQPAGAALLDAGPGLDGRGAGVRAADVDGAVADGAETDGVDDDPHAATPAQAMTISAPRVQGAMGGESTDV